MDEGPFISKSKENTDANATFMTIIAGTIALGVVAVGLGVLLKIPLGALVQGSLVDGVIGLLAMIPLVAFLWWFMHSTSEKIVEFRQSQIAFFAGIGFSFTWPRIIIMALAAGICEELLFRGIFQTYADRFLPIIVAILLTNIIFGALHWRTALYAAIAGMVGVYLACLYWLTGNLMAPIVTHSFYDFIALWYTREAIKNH